MTVPVEPFRAMACWTRDEANALQVLARNIRGYALQWGGATWQLTLQPLIGPQALQACTGEWCIGLTWSGLPFEVVVPQAGAQAWIQARFPDLDLPALPEPFVLAAFEDACESLVSLLPGSPPECVRVEKWVPVSEVEVPLPHAFLIELRADEVTLRAQLATSAQGLLHMAGMARRLPPGCNNLDVSPLPVKLAAVIGMTWLSLEDMVRLRPRDTILFDVRVLEQDGALWLGQGDLGFRVARQGPELTVTEEFMEQKWIAPPSEESEGAGAELSALDHLPLRVVFDLGELSMTLEQLKSLQVGQPLALSRPLASAVNLRVNGALIGTGELVEIEGELGVTITSLFQRPAGKSSRVARSGARARSRPAPDTQEEVTS